MVQTISIQVRGQVQGVFYRRATREKALELGLTGTVQNLQDNTVRLVVTGTKQQLDEMLAWCRQGPPRAKVTDLHWQHELPQSFPHFSVIR